MRIFAGLLLGLVISIQCLSDSLPNRQRRLSVHFLEKTPTGVYLLEQVGSKDFLFSIYIFDEIRNQNSLMLAEYISTEEGEKLNVNAELLASSSTYMSWALADGISKYRVAMIEKKYNVKLPLFIESTQWAMYLAMKHWDELGQPNDHDYANHPDRHIADVALKLQASTTELSRFFNASKDSFLKRAARRHISLGYPNISIKDYIGSSTSSPQQKDAARELYGLIRNELK